MTRSESAQRVSVIIPYFNASRWIQETLDSVTLGGNQSISEIVLVDDGSEPQETEILKKLAADTPMLRVLRNSRNLGGAQTRNNAVRSCQSDWIYCIDADNLASPGLIDALLSNALDNNLDVSTPEYVVFFSENPAQPTHAWRFRSTPIQLLDHFACAYVPSASGNYLFNKSSFEKAQGYPSFSRSLDTWGFGLRQLATGAQMLAAPGAYYFHRFGHPSYWVRESAKSGLSLIATSLALPFEGQLPKGLTNRLMGMRKRKWFDQLAAKPIWSVPGAPAGQLIPNLEGLSFEARLPTPPQATPGA